MLAWVGGCGRGVVGRDIVVVGRTGWGEISDIYRQIRGFSVYISQHAGSFSRCTIIKIDNK